MALIRVDSRTMLSMVFFLSLVSSTLLARPSEFLSVAPSPPVSETDNKSVTVSLIADDSSVMWVYLAEAVLCFVLWTCRKFRPPPTPTRTEEDSKPGSWITYGVRDLIAATRNFSVSNLVGEGGFGRVYRADFGENRIAAVKRLREDLDSTFFSNELSILLRIPYHKHLVNLIGLCSDPGYQVIVFDYVANGTLFSRLHENQGVASPLSWAARKKIARQVAEALKYLHEVPNPPIIHRDVKSKNVLLENDSYAKLADFGIAKFGPKYNRSTGTTHLGTFGYMDPKCVTDNTCSAKSDVYSFGVLLLELITGSEALIGSDALVNRTRTDRLSTNPNNIMKIVDQSLPGRNNYSHELVQMGQIANRCLQSERGDRPSMADVVNRMQGIGNANAL